MEAAADDRRTFWEHLDELRTVIIKIVIAIVICSIIAFCFKEQLFDLLLAPKFDTFITYRWLDDIARSIGSDVIPQFDVQLINTALASQFLIHVKAAACIGVLGAAPYIIYCLFMFIAPALYDREKRYATRVAAGGYIMFMIGAATSYLLIFPLTFRFLGTYQVSGEVTNMISLDSYMSTLIMMTLSLGIVFEMPVVAWLLGKAGIIDSSMLRKYRRHAIIVIMIVAAIITPTTDVFTLLAVSLPMVSLYEVSILIVRKKIAA